MAHLSATEVHVLLAKLSSEYIRWKNKEVLDRAQLNFKDPCDKLNYLPTFITILDHTLKTIEHNICLNTLADNHMSEDEATAQFHKLELKNLGFLRSTLGEFGNGKKGSKRNLHRSPLDNVKRDYLGNVVFKDSKTPAYHPNHVKSPGNGLGNSHSSNNCNNMYW